MSPTPAIASLIAQSVKNLPAVQETQVQVLGWADPLEKEMVIHSSMLAWRIPWTEEPGGLQFIGSQRVGHDWASKRSTHTAQMKGLSQLEKGENSRNEQKSSYTPIKINLKSMKKSYALYKLINMKPQLNRVGWPCNNSRAQQGTERLFIPGKNSASENSIVSLFPTALPASSSLL